MPTVIESSAGQDAWIEIVKQKVQSMKFGSVQIIVHEGRVTQVESTEKTRLNSNEAPPRNQSSTRG